MLSPHAGRDTLEACSALEFRVIEFCEFRHRGVGLAFKTYVRGEGRDRFSEINDRHLEQEEQCSSIEF